MMHFQSFLLCIFYFFNSNDFAKLFFKGSWVNFYGKQTCCYDFREATSVFKRRTDLEWNDFDQFKNDSKNFAFVEVVYQTGDEKGDFF